MPLIAPALHAVITVAGQSPDSTLLLMQVSGWRRIITGEASRSLRKSLITKISCRPSAAQTSIAQPASAQLSSKRSRTAVALATADAGYERGFRPHEPKGSADADSKTKTPAR